MQNTLGNGKITRSPAPVKYINGQYFGIWINTVASNAIIFGSCNDAGNMGAMVVGASLVHWIYCIISRQEFPF
ncbi:Uncharacterised protein [Mycobacteroides abscessus subsp. abscessus]|nr:Uncharacterised protein [Mycobacteroides abscessus subsp. abscessus]